MPLVVYWYVNRQHANTHAACTHDAQQDGERVVHHGGAAGGVLVGPQALLGAGAARELGQQPVDDQAGGPQERNGLDAQALWVK